MAVFGRKRDDPVVEPVPWEGTGGVGGFVVGDVLRPAAFRRKALTGERAVREPTMRDGVRYFAPAAVVTRLGEADDRSPSYELHAAVEPGGAPLCVLTPVSRGTAYRVTGADGTELGHVHRTSAAKRAVQHGWWLRQPGHPEIVARYHWARGSAKDIAARGREKAVRGAGALVSGVVDSVAGLGAEGGDQRSTHVWKPVTWRTGDEEEDLVLTSDHLDGVRVHHPHAPWLDRRLAFALAVLREA